MEGSFASKVVRLGAQFARSPRHVVPYLSTLRANPVDVELPWIAFGAIEFLSRWLKPHHRVFEYGSGGSTLFFSQRCKEVVSIESDPKWVSVVSSALRYRRASNVRLVERTETRRPSAATSPYCLALDEQFDAILVDSFCNWPQNDLRAPCFARAENFINPGGIIILDDPQLAPVVARRSSRQLSFVGLGPCRRGVTGTDIYLY